MKYLILLITLISFNTYGAEAAIVVFGGTGQAASSGIANSGVGGSTGAAIVGAAATQSSAGTITAGTANTTITPSGVTSSNVDFSQSAGFSQSQALGIAAGNSLYGANSTSVSGAIGDFGSIGLGVILIP